MEKKNLILIFIMFLFIITVLISPTFSFLCKPSLFLDTDLLILIYFAIIYNVVNVFIPVMLNGLFINWTPFFIIFLNFIYIVILIILEEPFEGIDVYIRSNNQKEMETNTLNEKLKSLTTNSGLFTGFLMAGLIFLISIYFQYFITFNSTQKIAFYFSLGTIIFSISILYLTLELAETYIDSAFTNEHKKKCRLRCQELYILGYQGVIFTLLFLLTLINLLLLQFGSIMHIIIMTYLGYFYPK